MEEVCRDKSSSEIKEPRKPGAFHMLCNHHQLTMSSSMRVKIKRSFTLYLFDLMDVRLIAEQPGSLE